MTKQVMSFEAMALSIDLWDLLQEMQKWASSDPPGIGLRRVASDRGEVEVVKRLCRIS